MASLWDRVASHRDTPPAQPWEWLEMCRHIDRQPSGWVPRWVAESIGVDCSVLDRNRGRPAHERGAIFYSREQSRLLRESRYWTPDLPADPPAADGGGA